jgi:hypothetical protein
MFILGEYGNGDVGNAVNFSVPLPLKFGTGDDAK